MNRLAPRLSAGTYSGQVAVTFRIRMRSDPPHDQQYDKNDQYNAKNADAAMAKAITIAAQAAAESSRQNDDENDDQNQTK